MVTACALLQSDICFLPQTKHFNFISYLLLNSPHRSCKLVALNWMIFMLLATFLWQHRLCLMANSSNLLTRSPFKTAQTAKSEENLSCESCNSKNLSRGRAYEVYFLFTYFLHLWPIPHSRPMWGGSQSAPWSQCLWTVRSSARPKARMDPYQWPRGAAWSTWTPRGFSNGYFATVLCKHMTWKARWVSWILWIFILSIHLVKSS